MTHTAIRRGSARRSHLRVLPPAATAMHFVMAAALSGVLFGPAGCRKDEPSFEVLSLEGRIEKVDVATDGTGSVSVLYYNEKQKQDVIGVGVVTPETEIMINGALGKLSDLRAGDRIRGEVRVEGKGADRKQIAIKIRIDRAGAG